MFGAAQPGHACPKANRVAREQENDCNQQRENGLADVQQLAGAIADDMDPENLAALPVKDELEASGGIAADLAAGEADIAQLPVTEASQHSHLRLIFTPCDQGSNPVVDQPASSDAGVSDRPLDDCHHTRGRAR